jgi:hypothetical protein
LTLTLAAVTSIEDEEDYDNEPQPEPETEEDEDNTDEEKRSNDESNEWDHFELIVLPNPEPDVTYTRPCKLPGFLDHDYDIPLPRITPEVAEQRRIALGLSRLPDWVQSAMITMEHPIDIPTVYLDETDLWSVGEESWNTKGPQCWEEAPHLCLHFALMGNRYQAPSSYVALFFSMLHCN